MRRIALLAMCLTLSLTGLALAKGTTYNGTTSQFFIFPGHDSIALKVKGSAVKHLQVQFDLTCGQKARPPLSLGVDVSFKIKKHKFHGKFKHAYPNGTVHGKISGTFSGSTVTGTLRVREGTTCDTGKVTYTATKQ